jgi:nucleoside-diphosphate-sugar epimerase
MAKLIFGCGYLGSRIAQLWMGQGHTVYALTRSAEKAKMLEAKGVRAIVGDLLASVPLSLPAELGTVLFAVGYDKRSPASIQDVYADGVRRALGCLPDSVERFIYISTTGVYGNISGSEVDEHTPCQPLRAGSIASRHAEQILEASNFHSRALILRMAGLYGPNRIPRSTDLVAGRPIEAPERGWLNLIHVDDAAQIVLLAEQGAPLPRTYVVSDGQPVIRAEYYSELARLLNAPPPKFVEPPGVSPAAARAASDKRVNPRRMFAELSPTLQYPSYRQGLAAIVAANPSRKADWDTG